MRLCNSGVRARHFGADYLWALVLMRASIYGFIVDSCVVTHTFWNCMFLLLANNDCNMQILNRRSGDEAQCRERRQALPHAWCHRCANTPQSISRAAGGKHLSTSDHCASPFSCSLRLKTELLWLTKRKVGQAAQGLVTFRHCMRIQIQVAILASYSICAHFISEPFTSSA